MNMSKKILTMAVLALCLSSTQSCTSVDTLVEECGQVCREGDVDEIFHVMKKIYFRTHKGKRLTDEQWAQIYKAMDEIPADKQEEVNRKLLELAI